MTDWQCLFNYWDHSSKFSDPSENLCMSLMWKNPLACFLHCLLNDQCAILVCYFYIVIIVAVCWETRTSDRLKTGTLQSLVFSTNLFYLLKIVCKVQNSTLFIIIWSLIHKLKRNKEWKPTEFLSKDLATIKHGIISVSHNIGYKYFFGTCADKYFSIYLKFNFHGSSVAYF